MLKEIYKFINKPLNLFRLETFWSFLNFQISSNCIYLYRITIFVVLMIYFEENFKRVN